MAKNIARTAVFLAMLTLISKCLGFVREMVMANFYGTSYVVDAYVMANSIPGILFGGILGAVATAYMPIFSRLVENEGNDVANRYTSAVINILLIGSAVSSLVGLLFSEQIVAIFASGFSGETAALTSFFVKVTFSFSLIVSTSGILNAFLQYNGVFVPQVVIGFTNSFSIIIFIILSTYTSPKLIILGYIVSYLIQLLAYIVIAKRKEFKYKITLRSGGNTRGIIVLALPVFIGSMAGQINTFVDRSLASGLPEGSVAALNYGNLILGLVSGLTISIFTILIYPRLAQSAATEDYDRLNNILNTGITLVAIISIPATLGAMVYSNQIVQVIYERGAFDPNSTGMTAIAMLFYALGLGFGGVGGLLVYTFYSLHDTKTPAILGFISVGVNISLNLLLIGPLKHGGLALATSIATIVSTALLYFVLKKKHKQVQLAQSKRKLAKICFSAVVAVGISYLVYRFGILAIAHIIYPRMIQLTLAAGVAVMVYYPLLHVFKIEETHLVRSIFKK